MARCPELASAGLALVTTLALASGCDEGPPEPELATAPDDSELEAVQLWLHSRAYHEWERHDPVPEPGMSGGARVYLSPELAASLRAGSGTHPPGSAAVREIVDPEDPEQMIGWAMSHKLEPSSELEPGMEGDAWFFYEVFSLEPDAAPLVAERGAPGCVGCHQEGRDFVQSVIE